MTDAWDERTEAIPGTKGEKSFELELEFVENTEPTNAPRASVVVFEPTAIGLADALQELGLDVRMGTTGVDVMSVVARDAPGAVLCAPAPDAERRRLLAAALRLRFPQIPIIYVSTHAGQEDAVLGAVREGARAVLAWPLPPPAQVMRVLGPYLSPTAQSATGPSERAPAARTIAGIEEPAETVKCPLRPPASAEGDADVFEDAATLVTPSNASREPLPLGKKPAPVTVASAKEAQVPQRIAGFADEPATQPNLRPAANAVQEALAEKRGEIGDLLAAVSPFLWSLEDASRWAGELGAKGDPVAQSHARTLMLLAKILAQLQARIDDVGV